MMIQKFLPMILMTRLLIKKSLVYKSGILMLIFPVLEPPMMTIL